MALPPVFLATLPSWDQPCAGDWCFAVRVTSSLLLLCLEQDRRKTKVLPGLFKGPVQLGLRAGMNPEETLPNGSAYQALGGMGALSQVPAFPGACAQSSQ